MVGNDLMVVNSDVYEQYLQVSGYGEVRFIVADTISEHSFARIRQIGYIEADVVLCCYGIDNVDSFTHVMTAWVPEIRKYLPKAPILLVAMRSDLRDETVKEQVTKQQGSTMKKDIGAELLIECSAKIGYNVQHVFRQAIRFGLKASTPSLSTCLVC